jgi:hypothetical protein
VKLQEWAYNMTVGTMNYKLFEEAKEKHEKFYVEDERKIMYLGNYHEAFLVCLSAVITPSLNICEECIRRILKMNGFGCR